MGYGVEIGCQVISVTLISDDSVDPMQYRNQNGISRKPEVEYRERFFDSH